jgi:hypothetical protein
MTIQNQAQTFENVPTEPGTSSGKKKVKNQV